MKKFKKQKNGKNNLSDRQTLVSEIENESLCMLAHAEQMQKKMAEIYPQLPKAENAEKIQNYAASLKRTTKNLAKACMKIYKAGDELSARSKDMEIQKKWEKRHVAMPANTVIDLYEDGANHFFAKGLSAYKLLLIFFAGSFVGVMVEMLWCLARYGYLESRAGLVYGPFNPLYGAGAVLMTVCLYRFRNHGAWISFFGSMLIGGGVEYFCSWGQEFVFGSRSWDYSDMPFNINGRICLLYTFFWGFLGVFWIKRIYPLLSKWILKLPNRTGKIITWTIVIFFIVDIASSGVAMFRWTQRIERIAPANQFWEFVDERFPDERMERVYANMEFSKEK